VFVVFKIISQAHSQLAEFQIARSYFCISN